MGPSGVEASSKEQDITMASVTAASTAASIADSLEEQIVLGRVYPRERLLEDELMARFDAKRHVVRAAFQLLEGRGLVERRPNVGVAVKSFSDAEVEQLYELRMLLESNAAQLIQLPVSDEALRPIVEARDEHRAAVESRDLPAIVQANDRFHREIFSLTNNPYLTDVIRRHAQMASPIRFLNVSSPEKMQRSMAEHDLIVEALRGQDSLELARLCRDHLLPSRNFYLNQKASSSA
ncbi:GntR family transcriptional regulator [Citricoccus zhacaiensis]|uniref:GntR family transcriptional regulator n=2 Tax=Citricoccus zhacaiensis TaxID=489142 RepID=A0ABQ2M558_9MICC|nr:GntR family transcriptional regulator [Citricoccus zhacaiensis]